MKNCDVISENLFHIRAKLEKEGWDAAKRKHRRVEEKEKEREEEGETEADSMFSDEDRQFLSLLDSTPVNLTNQLQYLCLQVMFLIFDR